MLRQAVLATIVYYDALDYPMTEFEVWKHLLVDRESDPVMNRPTLGQIAGAIESLVAEQAIERRWGMLTLPLRSGLIEQRIQREKASVPKIRRAAALVRRLAWVPFIRMIALTGSLSMKVGDRGSDWDFFVVLAQGAIWRGRTMLSLVLQLLGKRRHGNFIENRACLNHFVTEASLEVAMHDYYSASEYRFMYTLMGRDTERRFELANRWMARLKPNFEPSVLPNSWHRRASRVQSAIQTLCERCLGWQGWEAFLSEWQRKMIERNPKSQTPGAFIVATDEALIFLPHPRGPIIYDRFKERLSRV